MSSTNTSIPTRAGGASRQRLRDRLLLGGLFALVITGLASLATATGWEETWAQIAILLALAVFCVATRTQLLLGIPPEVSVPATLIIRLLTLWFAIGIGLAVFPFAERSSMKAKHALETR